MEDRSRAWLREPCPPSFMMRARDMLRCAMQNTRIAIVTSGTAECGPWPIVSRDVSHGFRRQPRPMATGTTVQKGTETPSSGNDRCLKRYSPPSWSAVRSQVKSEAARCGRPHIRVKPSGAARNGN